MADLWELWGFFIVCTLLLGVTVWHFWQRAHGEPIVGLFDNPIPWHYDLTFLAFALIGVICTVPGLFFGQPRWAAEQLYWFITRVLERSA